MDVRDERRQPGRRGEPEALDAHAGGGVGQDPGDGLQVGHGRGRAVRLEALGWRAIHGHLYHERVIILLYEGCMAMLIAAVRLRADPPPTRSPARCGACTWTGSNGTFVANTQTKVERKRAREGREVEGVVQ